jgi:hypothetical protein
VVATAVPSSPARQRLHASAFPFVVLLVVVELVWGLFLGYLLFSYVLPLF